MATTRGAAADGDNDTSSDGEVDSVGTDDDSDGELFYQLGAPAAGDEDMALADSAVFEARGGGAAADNTNGGEGHLRRPRDMPS